MPCIIVYDRSFIKREFGEWHNRAMCQRLQLIKYEIGITNLPP